MLTGGPWGTLAHVDAGRDTTELRAMTALDCLLATLMVDNIFDVG
jgi:hypothetical protein